MRRVTASVLFLSLVATLGCAKAEPGSPGVITIALVSSPVNLDPRVGTDEVSQRIRQLIFDPLLAIVYREGSGR